MKESPKLDPLRTVRIRSSDPEGHRLIESARVSTKNAQAMLAWIAKQLRLEAPLDRCTAEFIATAFDRAARAAPSVAAAELGRKLFLTAENRRPKANVAEVALRFFQLYKGVSAPEVSKRKAKEQVATEFQIDMRTVDRCIAKHWGANILD